MMRLFKADMHVHSVLSPCAAIEMTPRNIIWHAVREEIDIVAITDHNACDNVMYALEAAKSTNVVVLPGMEVESKEEIHFIVLFEKIRQLKTWGKFVQNHMSGRLNDEKRFGAQFVVDAEDNLVCVKQEMLLTSLTISAAEISLRVAELGGICIASHVDRPMYSIISQLGFIPEDVELTAVEVSCRVNPQNAGQIIPGIGSLPVITSSDAHTIMDFVNGPKINLYMESPSFDEIKMALKGQSLRKVVF
jgi:PHP family Zn ribbon phosphoesterase